MAYMVDELVHKYTGDLVITLVNDDLVINLPLAHTAQNHVKVFSDSLVDVQHNF